MNTKTKIAIGLTSWAIFSAAAIFFVSAGDRKTSEVYELRCGLGTDGTGPIFTGVKRIELSNGVFRMTFIEDGQTFYKMRDGEYCMPTTVAP